MAKKNITADPEFSDKIKDIISKRASYRCSYTGCGNLLVGPGVEKNEFMLLGECAHIFSAAINGPRTSGNLKPEELCRADNGMLLCRKHHKLIDRKHKSNRYTSGILIQMKDRHEFRISAEIGENNYPLHWIKSFEVSQCKVLAGSVRVNLGKLTFINGANCIC